MMTNMNIFSKILMLVPWLTPTWVDSAPRQPRLSLAEPMPAYFYNNIGGHPGTYSFGYDVSDAATGNAQYRSEERYPNGTVVGSYGYLDPAGLPQRYRYIADERGYRVMRDRLRPAIPAYNPQPSIPSPVLKEQGDTVTWSRKKSNRVMTKPEIRRNKIVPFPGNTIWNF